MFHLIRKQKSHEEIVCENCIKLEERKKKLKLEIENCIKEEKEKIEISKSQFNKQKYLENFKKKSKYLTKSIL